MDDTGGDPPDNVVPGPFQDARTIEARDVGIAKAHADAAERRAWALERVAVAQQIVTAYDEFLLNPKDLSKLFKAGAAKVALDVLRGETEVRHAADAASIINALVTAGRLEAGEHTSENITLNSDEARERVLALRDEADRRLEAAVKAEELQKVVPFHGPT